jgi:hypothetical protein
MLFFPHLLVYRPSLSTGFPAMTGPHCLNDHKPQKDAATESHQISLKILRSEQCSGEVHEPDYGHGGRDFVQHSGNLSFLWVGKERRNEQMLS